MLRGEAPEMNFETTIEALMEEVVKVVGLKYWVGVVGGESNYQRRQVGGVEWG